jgi:hypothetical protein
MLSRGLVRRIAALAILAALVIAGAVAWNYHPMPFLQAVSGPINAEGLSPEPMVPVDPGFTGGPPVQPNMGTKPPTAVQP